MTLLGGPTGPPDAALKLLASWAYETLKARYLSSPPRGLTVEDVHDYIQDFSTLRLLEPAAARRLWLAVAARCGCANAVRSALSREFKRFLIATRRASGPNEWMAVRAAVFRVLRKTTTLWQSNAPRQSTDRAAQPVYGLLEWRTWAPVPPVFRGPWEGELSAHGPLPILTRAARRSVDQHGVYSWSFSSSDLLHGCRLLLEAVLMRAAPAHLFRGLRVSQIIDISTDPRDPFPAPEAIDPAHLPDLARLLHATLSAMPDERRAALAASPHLNPQGEGPSASARLAEHRNISQGQVSKLRTAAQLDLNEALNELDELERQACIDLLVQAVKADPLLTTLPEEWIAKTGAV